MVMHACIRMCLLVLGYLYKRAHLDIKLVGQGFEEDRCCRDLLVGRVVAMSQVASAGQVQAHNAVMGVQQRSVDSKVGRAMD